MCKFARFLFTMFACDGKVGRGDLVGGTLQMGTGELTSTPSVVSKAHHRAQTLLFVAALTCCINALKICLMEELLMTD